MWDVCEVREHQLQGVLTRGQVQCRLGLPTAKVDQRFRSGQRQVHRRHILGIHQQVMVTGVFLWLSIRQHQAGWANAHAFQAKNHANGPRTVLPFLGIRISTFAPLGDGLRGILLSSAQVNCASKAPARQVNNKCFITRMVQTNCGEYRSARKSLLPNRSTELERARLFSRCRIPLSLGCLGGLLFGRFLGRLRGGLLREIQAQV